MAPGLNANKAEIRLLITPKNDILPQAFIVIFEIIGIKTGNSRPEPNFSLQLVSGALSAISPNKN